MIVWFASYFVTIEMLIPGSIIVKNYENYKYSSAPAEFFG